MNKFVKFFHELRNPHCEHCKEALEDSRICQSCETLKIEIERLRLENKQLIDHVLNPPIKAETEEREVPQLKPVMPNRMPWNVRRQALEAEDRQKARLMHEASARAGEPLTAATIEKELGVEDATG